MRGFLRDLNADFRYGFRCLRRTPGFTLTAALSLAIGIGANTAIYAVATSLLFRPPGGITEPGRLIDIGTARGDGGLNPVSYDTYLEIARNARSCSGVFAQHLFTDVMSLVSSETGASERVVGHYVSTNFFAVLGTRPYTGRVFVAGDDDAVAVLDHGFWVRRFNGDPGVVGRVLRINGRAVTVVGVAAQNFQGTGIQRTDLWLAIGADGKSVASVVPSGRLRPGGSAPAAAAEMAAIGDGIDRARGITQRHQRLNALPFSRVGGNRNIVAGFSVALMAIVSLVLAVACANVAGAVLARATARGKELALRTALGAGRGRLVRQLLTETVMLFLLGGALGLALAHGIILLAPRVGTLPTQVAVPVTLDWRVWIFALALSLLAALVSGLVPAFKDSKADPVTSLKEAAGSYSSRARLRGAFVVAQIAISILLVVLAGLFVRAVRYAGMTSPGFDPRGVEIATLDLSMVDGDEPMRADFWRNVMERVRDLPAVEAASLARVPPGGFEGIGLGGVAAADTVTTSELFVPAWNIVDSGYFATLRIPLLAGREFSPGDVAGAPPLVIVGDAIARRFWPGRGAVGEPLMVSVFNARTRKPERRIAHVVGVVADIKSSSVIDGLAEPYVYLPLGQSGETGMAAGMSIVARSRGAGRLTPELGAVVRELNPNLVVIRSETLEDSVALGLAPQRLLAGVAGSLGFVGLLLASIGIYGVLAYTVALRRREFGIRMALGARHASIVWMVLRQGMVLVGVGASIGLGLAAGAGQVLSVFLYGLPAIHLPTFLGTCLLFAAIGAAACYVPARHAIRIEPLRALRHD
jgi:predicted permease